MKNISFLVIISTLVISCSPGNKKQEVATEPVSANANKYLFLDVHNLEPGKVTYDAVAGAHQKDLATQDKFGVNFVKYWVDEAAGKVYCLATSPDSASIYQSHKEAHGLVPDLVQLVSDGPEAATRITSSPLFMDVHHLGAGKVKAEDVAKAHEKDLAVQDKYKVNFVNYWVNEKLGVVMCLAEAPDSAAMTNAHKEAHGLIPDEMHKVKEGN